MILNYSEPLSCSDYTKNDFGLQSTTSFEQLFKKAFLAFRNITKTDYNQLVLFTKYNKHTSELIVYTEDIPAHKQNYLLVVQEGFTKHLQRKIKKSIIICIIKIIILMQSYKPNQKLQFRSNTEI